MEDCRIQITNPIFTINPSLKFAETMNCPTWLWTEMYYRYKTMNYSKGDLKEWFEFKTKKYISYKTICRWVVRQELYDDVKDIRHRGVKIVNSQFFTRNQEEAKNPSLIENEN